MSTVKLDVLSDPICPWCYIGKTNLEKALAAVQDHPFVIEWHPFQLNPEMPIEGMDRRTYLESKFGGKDAAVRAYAPVVEHAEKAGITINLDAIKRTPNTLNAHRLIHWAGIESKQNAVVDALFQAYFVDGKDIGDIATLADIGAAAGMERDVLENLLNGDSDTDTIRDRDSHSRKMGVTSVPTFIVANQHAVPGAQPPELWAQVIKDITDQLETAEK